MFQKKQTSGYSGTGISKNKNHPCDTAGSSADEIL
jgi:hypothetical protein